MKRLTVYIIAFTFVVCLLRAQTPALYNSNTLFDSFENPAQTAFVFNKTRKYASNTIFPSLGAIDLVAKGKVIELVPAIYFDNRLDLSKFDYNSTDKNEIFGTSNNYIFMYRSPVSYFDAKEVGVSWQIRLDIHGYATNQILSVGGNLNTLSNDMFNLNARNALSLTAQAYHQISYVIKRQYSDLVTYGLKMSVLSGIFYNNIKLDAFSAGYDKDTNTLSVNYRGSYTSSYSNQSISPELLKPSLRNLGIAVTASILFALDEQTLFFFTLKDLGFIRWSDKSGATIFQFDTAYSYDTNNDYADQFSRDLFDLTKDEVYNEAFVKPINGRVEFLFTKQISRHYIPNVLVSKSIVSNYDYIYINNNLWFGNFNVNANVNLNFAGTVNFGVHFLAKFPNIEFYVGSDKLFKSLNLINTLQNEATYDRVFNPPIAAGVYIGISFKFGEVISTPSTANVFPRR